MKIILVGYMGSGKSYVGKLLAEVLNYKFIDLDLFIEKKEGDKISTGDILAEVETDKATMDLESFQDGTLLYIGVKEGPVPVDGIIAIIGEAGEDYKELLKQAEIRESINLVSFCEFEAQKSVLQNKNGDWIAH